MVKMVRPPEPLLPYTGKSLDELRREALATRKPTWPYPGGPTDCPANASNLRGPDGVVRSLDHDGMVRDHADRQLHKNLAPTQIAQTQNPFDD